MFTSIHRVNVKLAERYLDIIDTISSNTDPLDPTSIQHVKSMCHYIVEHPTMLLDKQSRWIGYIQGVLMVRGHLSMLRERELTRPMFHDAYREEGIAIPESADVIPETQG